MTLLAWLNVALDCSSYQTVAFGHVTRFSPTHHPPVIESRIGRPYLRVELIRQWAYQQEQKTPCATMRAVEQLGVGERNQSLNGRTITGAPVEKQPCHVSRRTRSRLVYGS
jgi:hypothetical protein